MRTTPALKPISTLIITGFCLLAAACSLVPDDHPAPPPMPARWSADQGAAAVPVHPSWWQDFHDPALSALVGRSLTGNFSLQAAIARIEEAQGTAEAAGAAQYPAVEIDGTVDRGSGRGTSLRANRSQNIFAQARYEIDFWGKNRAQADAAAAAADAQRFDADTVALSLTASVADLYFQVLSLGERVRLATAIAANGRRILELVQAQAQYGIASQLEVSQQRNAVATFDAAVPALRQALDQARHQLGILTGAGPESPPLPAVGLDGIAPPEIRPDLPATLLRRRPDIRAAEARLTAANDDIGVARAAFFPSLTLTGAGGVASRSLRHFFPPVALSDLGAGLVQPVFAGGQLEGNLRTSRAHAVELTASYRQTVLVALGEVEDALTAAGRLKEIEAADQDAVVAARRAAALADAQFRIGTANFLTVLDTQRVLYQAEDALLQLRLQRLQAAVGLFRALGGGFDQNEKGVEG